VPVARSGPSGRSRPFGVRSQCHEYVGKSLYRGLAPQRCGGGLRPRRGDPRRSPAEDIVAVERVWLVHSDLEDRPPHPQLLRPKASRGRQSDAARMSDRHDTLFAFRHRSRPTALVLKRRGRRLRRQVAWSIRPTALERAGVLPPNGLSAPISLPTHSPRRCASPPGEGLDLSRASVRLVMQELIETEAEQRIGAVRHECTAIRVCGSQRLNAAVR
jgi:hypothetical protein